jgi:hypothetical protein
VINFLRLVGVFNAAVWFGATIFHLIGVSPALSSQEMNRIFGEFYAAVALQMTARSFYLLQHWCGAIALVHLVAEWLYMDKPMEKFQLWLVTSLFLLGLIGGFWLQPRINQLHRAKHMETTPALQEQAADSLRVWSTVSGIFHLLVAAGLVVHVYRVTTPVTTPRFQFPGLTNRL